MKPAPFDYERPTELDGALALLAKEEDAKLLAGGQSLGPMLNLRVATPGLLIDISRLDELRVIDDTANEIVIGAAVRHAEFEDGRVPSPLGNIFPRVASDIAYRAVRNRGTIGGSLAHADPAADWPAVMVALRATLSVRSRSGRRTLNVTELATGALETCLARDEIIETVHVPRLSKAARIGRYKVNRKPGDFAEAMAMIVLDPESKTSRVVISGGSFLPAILPNASAAVESQSYRVGGDLEGTVDAELSGFELSEYEFRLFRACVLRAAKEALDR